MIRKYPPRQKIHTPNLCLRCWLYFNGKCNKTPEDYCKITKSRT